MMGWRLSKKFAFEAAHQLTHLPPEHKCARPHGHSYVVEVVMKCYSLDARGFAGMDYADLDPLGDYIKKHFDHRDLNVVMGNGMNTTAEILAQFFFKWCEDHFDLNPNMGAKVDCVRVYETAKTYAEYRRD